MALVVSDTSPVRALAHLALLDLLRQLYSEVLVPDAVVQELGMPTGNLPLVDPGQFPFFRIQTPRDRNQVQKLLQVLDAGESEAIALAIEVQAPILIDEAAGRRMARREGLRIVGTLGVLVEAKKLGLLAQIRPLIERLETEIKFFIAPALRARVLQLAGE